MKEDIINFIKKTGNTKESKLFLDWIHNTPPLKFALIKISGECLEDNLDDIITDIAYLNKFGLYPIIVHGAGKTLDSRLPHNKKEEGIRITNESDIKIIEETYTAISEKLVVGINKNHGKAQKSPIVLSCSVNKKYGKVGIIKSVDVQKLKDMVENNITPIVSPLGFDENTQELLNINADDVAKAIVDITKPKKLILLTATGGIFDKSGNIMQVINVGSKSSYNHVSGGMLHKLKELIKFLDKHKKTSVVITSPNELLKEIFTIKGSGTFIKYHEIFSQESIVEENIDKIKNTLEQSFKKKVKESFLTKICDSNEKYSLFYESNFEGIAIIKKLNKDVIYLDKFAVIPLRQGTGLGKSIWSEIIKLYPKIIWRSKTDNPFNVFYSKECDGLIKDKGWWIFWKGLNLEESKDFVEELLGLEDTMIENK